MLCNAMSFNWIKRFNVGTQGSNSLEASHILYANDRLILRRAEEVQLRHFRVIQLLFETVSGLKFNMGKFSTFLVSDRRILYNLFGHAFRCQIQG